MPKIMLDFSDVKRQNFDPQQLKPGSYRAAISGCELTKTKSDNTDMLVYTITIKGHKYPYYCKLVPTQLWKLRDLLEAAGLKVPAKAVQVDPARVVGKTIIATVEDDEYNGRVKSVISGVAPVGEESEEEPEEDEYDEPEDEEPEPTPKRTRRAKQEPLPTEDDDDFDDFDDFA